MDEIKKKKKKHNLASSIMIRASVGSGIPTRGGFNRRVKI
jgi:hypothetical protein